MKKILMFAITAIASTTLQAQYSGQVPTNLGGASQNAAAGAVKWSLSKKTWNRFR